MLLWTSSMDRSQVQSPVWVLTCNFASSSHRAIVSPILQNWICHPNMDAPFSQNSEKPARNHFPKMLQPVRNHPKSMETFAAVDRCSPPVKSLRPDPAQLPRCLASNLGRLSPATCVAIGSTIDGWSAETARDFFGSRVK